jgi:lactate dehydrogenase-like 2-hydroxyacid dehydrogenase
LLDAAPHLGCEHPSVGYDHIDLAACNERGVTSAIRPAADPPPPILAALIRRLLPDCGRWPTRAWGWITWDLMALLGLEVSNSTLGISDWGGSGSGGSPGERVRG